MVRRDRASGDIALSRCTASGRRNSLTRARCRADVDIVRANLCAMRLRSLQADDYQDVPRPVAVLAKDFASRTRTGAHSHPRAQLLYATAGLMVVTTEDGTWAVPAGHALLIPPGVVHDVAMHGAVAMRTAYLTAAALAAPPSVCRVLRVSALLDAALVALSDEPVLY